MSTALVGGLLGAGLALNKGGRQAREIENVRTQIDPDEQPNQRNAYHSEQFYDNWNGEFALATKAFIQSRDTKNENVVPLYSNQMTLRQEMSPEMQDYVQKRGQRLGENDKIKKSFINEGFHSTEYDIQESPMFRPTGGFAANSDNINSVRVENSPYGVENSTAVSRMEHFGSYTVHGPVNSNDKNFHNNMVPFRKMRGMQNLDPEANQNRLEAFTGQTGSVTEFRAQPKREMPSFADRTVGQTFIYGAPSDLSVQADRYITSNLKTDVTPFQQIRVGAGISGSFDAKPRDGFHPWYRPEERNVDQLRVNPKNVYEGRLLPGAERVQNRGINGEVNKNRPDTFYINDQRRWNKTTGAFTAPQIRENFVAYKQNREDTNSEYLGPALNKANLQGYTGVYTGAPGGSNGVCANGEISPIRPSEMLERDAPNDPELTGELESGADCSIMSRVQHTERQQLRSEPYRNYGAQSYLTKQTQAPYDDAKTTIRQSTFVRDYQGGVHSGDLNKQTEHFTDEAKHTQKELHVRDYQGGVHSGDLNKQTEHYTDDAKHTQKELFVRDYQGGAHSGDLNKTKQYQQDNARTTTKQTAFVRNYQGISSANDPKTKVYQQDGAKSTIKQNTHVRDYQGISSANDPKTKQYQQDNARTTTKQTVFVRDYQGISSANGDNRKGMKYYDDKARNNIRNTLSIKNYVGGAGSVQTRNPVSYEAMYNATARNNAESLLEGRTYGPNKATNITVGACDINMQMKSRTGYDVTKYGPNETKQYQTIPNIEMSFSETTSRNERDERNPYSPEAFVVSAFNRNPYTQSLTSSPSMTSTFKRGETPFNGCANNTLSDPNIQYGQEAKLREGAMDNE